MVTLLGVMQEARLLENEPGLLPGGLDKELVGQVGEGESPS